MAFLLPPSRYVATWANVACVDGIAAAAPVGLHFPDGTYRTPDGRPRERWLLVRLPRLDAVEVEVTLASEVRVRSGFTETAELSVRNLGVRELSIRTTGNLTTRVVDPASGEVVGGCWGGQTTPLVVFRATRRRCDS